MYFKNKIIELLKKELKIKDSGLIFNTLEIPPNSQMGDYSFPCFKLSKNPIDEAKKLEKKIKKPKYISKIIATGPYLNFFIDSKYHTKRTIYNILNTSSWKGSTLFPLDGRGKEHTKTQIGYTQGKIPIKNPQRKIIIIESPGPNTNKPLHLGHIRNMLLGNSLVNLNIMAGNPTARVDIINDRGIHICKSMLAYKKFGKNKKPNKKPDHFVGDFYVKYDQEVKKNKSLESELNKLLIKWENKDVDTLTLWKKLNSWAMEGIKQTYKLFGTRIDKYYFESKHYKLGKKIVLEGLKKGIFQKDEKGNIIADLKDKGLGEKVVLRADGTSVYMTQDIALANLRYKDYEMDEMIYVVANEQDYHFKALFEILKKLKYKFTKNLHHLSYGYISLKGGKMKSREGTVIDADSMVSELIELTSKEFKKRNLSSQHKKITNKAIDKISKQIALGAIKFFMLKYDPKSDFIYHPGKSISLEGETGPYLQYTGVRLKSILKKSKRKKKKDSFRKLKNKVDYSLFNHNSEKKLINTLSTYGEILEKSTKEYKPSLLCHFLVNLCKNFNSFYQNCKVLENKNKELDNTRLILTYCTYKVLQNGLNILGIQIPQQM